MILKPGHQGQVVGQAAEKRHGSMSVRVDIAGQQNMVFQIYMLFCFGALLSLGL